MTTGGSTATPATSSADPPPRPLDGSPQQVGFVRRPMVRWFDPLQLGRTAVRATLSAVFGAYADKRELQGALEDQPSVHREYACEADLWLDFVADLGDGFAPTYTLAYLLGRSTLYHDATTGEIKADSTDGASVELPRGRVLVMGGDQVYPAAERDEYADRTLGPYRAALPWLGAGNPDLFAIPGNHDWYDGLTNFIRLFCQQEWVGAWKTRQNRSYFALKLPHGWWLWGIDVQFDTYIDAPQLAYFRERAKELNGDRVVLVTAKPSWKHGTDRRNDSYANLTFLEERVIEPRGALRVSVSGDDHHYARYASSDGTRQKITAGGGGAFLSATHHLRRELQLKRRDGTTVDYSLESAYPSRRISARRLRWSAIPRLPLKNGSFVAALVVAYLVPAVIVFVPLRRELTAGGESGFLHLLGTAVLSKWILYAGLVLVPLTFLFAAVERLGLRALLGLIHAAAHLGLLALAVAGWTWLFALVDWGWGIRQDLLIAVLAALLSSLAGAVVIGTYLALCDVAFGRRVGRHATELFACQRIEHRKNFLRMHFARDGSLTIYPIAVDPVADDRDIEFVDGGDGDPYFVPRGWKAFLIEEPIRVEPQGSNV